MDNVIFVEEATEFGRVEHDRLGEFIAELDAERMMPCVMDDAVFADA